jgi:hypothetical protein
MTPAPALAILALPHDTGSEIMSDEVLKLGHHEFIQRVQEVSFDPIETSGVLVRLYAAVEAHSSEPPGPGRHRRATTLAIRMDRAVATMLFQQIYETFLRMDWPRPPLDAPQA